MNNPFRNVQVEKIESALQAIISDGAVSVDTLDYLLFKCRKRPHDYNIGVAIVAFELSKAVASGYLNRWDFDPNDYHPDYHTVTIRQREPTEHVKRWPYMDKVRLLRDVIGAYRKRCYRINEELIDRCQSSIAIYEIDDIIQECEEQGVLQRKNGYLEHNPSWVHAKKVFEAIMIANDRLGYRQI